MEVPKLLDRLRNDLHDPSGVRYTLPMLLQFVSDAQRAIVLCRPDANAVVESVRLAEGSTRQTLPEGGVRFLGVLRNMGADGKTPGRAVRVASLESLNLVSANWHRAAPSSEIYDYAPDEVTPMVFWVSPAPGADVWVEIKYSAEPKEVSSSEGRLSILPVFSEPVREYALYRAYARNDASVDFQGRAALHLQRFFSLLGQEAQARLMTSPINLITSQTGNQVALAAR